MFLKPRKVVKRHMVEVLTCWEAHMNNEGHKETFNVCSRPSLAC